MFLRHVKGGAVTTWTIRFDDKGNGLTIPQIEAMRELFRSMKMEAVISSEPTTPLIDAKEQAMTEREVERAGSHWAERYHLTPSQEKDLVLAQSWEHELDEGFSQARAEGRAEGLAELERQCTNCGTTLARCYDVSNPWATPRLIKCCPDCDHRVIATVREMGYWAWTIIANAYHGDWESNAPKEWREAATKWRDAFHASQPERVECRHIPMREMMRLNERYMVPNDYCPLCGQSLKGAGDE